MAILKRKLMNQTGAALALALITLSAWSKPLPIWELESEALNSSGNRILLMGSVHFLRATDYPLRKGLDEAYRIADSVTMELDMSAMDPLTTQESLTAISIDPTGRGLKQFLGANDYRKAENLANDLSIPLMMFDQFEPWFAALSITQLRMVQLGFDNAWGIETMLTRKAVAEEKQLAGLETLEEQLGFLDRLDLDAQRNFLFQSLEHASSVQDDIEDIIGAWKRGDTAKLEKLLLEELEEQPELYDALLLQRNNNWVAQIKALRDEQGIHLVVVGTMHLIGDDSVLALLEDAGIASRQLTDADF